jgi:hypothetical protein
MLVNPVTTSVAVRLPGSRHGGAVFGVVQGVAAAAAGLDDGVGLPVDEK